MNGYSRWGPDEAKDIVTIMKMVIVIFLNIMMRERLREHDLVRFKVKSTYYERDVLTLRMAIDELSGATLRHLIHKDASVIDCKVDSEDSQVFG